MLQYLTVKNFKREESIDLDISGNVILVGPNNSGKTSVLQAII